MSNQRNYYQPKFLQETQLGLVVYGGVSLAIYTYGVCQEFYHAVRGRGVYKLVKALTDSDLVVDTISGSSAGGINGILLGYALANSNDREIVDFGNFARIWRNSGDLLKIVQKPNLFKSTSGTSFNRENIDRQDILTSTLLRSERKLPRSRQEWFSPIKELDVAIAATDYLGKSPRAPDAVGAKNHQALFLLKHRQGRKEPFNPHFQDPNLRQSPDDTYRALVKLCQMTAGTPAIFPLVEVDMRDRHNLVDRQLAIWGKFSKHYSFGLTTDRTEKLYFLDGGLLDNSPLTCLRKEAYYRLPTRRGTRKLFYIDPNPDNLIDRLQLMGKKQSRSVQMLQAAALSIPIHQSIANDLREIEEHNHKVRRYQTLFDRAEVAIESQQILESSDRTQSQIYLRGRLFDFLDRNLPLLIQTDLGAQNSRYSAIMDKIESIVSTKFANSRERHAYYQLLDRFESQTIDLDVEYSLRQHFFIIERIYELIDREPEGKIRQDLQCLANQLGCNIKLLEVIKTSIELLLRDPTIGNYFYYSISHEPREPRLRPLTYELIFRLHRFMLDANRTQAFVPDRHVGANLETIPACFWVDLPEVAAQSTESRWLSQARISSAFAQLKQRSAELHQNNDLRRTILTDPQLQDHRDRNQSFPSILKHLNLATETLLSKWGGDRADLLLKQWHTFEAIDRELYPFEYLTSIHEKEIVNPICISPDTAQIGIGNGKSTQDKLAGHKLYNIGGLFKKSWRANDLLWGRLDGLNRIVEGLITPKSVRAFARFIEREVARTNSSQAQYIDWLIAESLPLLSASERQTIGKHLERLAQPKLRIERSELQKIVTDIVTAGQREILTSDVHSAIEGMDEQPGWWRMGANNNLSARDRETSATTNSHPNNIMRIVHQSLANLSAQQQNFFRNQYRIGVDKLWENMPLVAPIAFCTRIVLFLRNLLIEVFQISSRTRKLRHPLYRALDGMLQSIYWWLQGGSIKLGASHRRLRIVLFQLLGITMALVGGVLTFLLSPLWLLLSLPGMAIWWLLKTMRLKRLTGAKGMPYLPDNREP